jgi:adenine/guanine phosphoribosyltransferase-like PRPP-binding protein
MPEAPTLEAVFDWIVENSTYVAVIIFLIAGVVAVFWNWALEPLLERSSKGYRHYLARRELDRVRPLLEAAGVLDQAERIRDLRRFSVARTARTRGQREERLLNVMAQHFIQRRVRLGKKVSSYGDYFVDLREAAMNARKRDELGDILADLISDWILGRIGDPGYKSIDKLVGMKEGNPLVAGEVSRKLNLPLVLFRGMDFPRFHGSEDPMDYMDGIISEHERTILIDDATFRGTTLLQAVQVIRRLGAEPLATFLLFEPFDSQARQSLEGSHIPICSVVEIDEKVISELERRPRS